METAQPNLFVERLRRSSIPVVARVEAGRVALDPRTVLPEQENALLAGLQTCLTIAA